MNIRLRTPPLSTYFDRLPKRGRWISTENKAKGECAAPGCHNKVKNENKYCCLACSRTMMKAQNGALNGKGFKKN